MAIDLTIDLLDEDCSNLSCNRGNYFLGSSRTYSYYVRWFKDPWQFHPQGLKFFCDTSNIQGYKAGDYVQGVYINSFFYEKGALLTESPFRTDPRCISSFAYSNPIWFEGMADGELGKRDALRLQKSYGIVSESINEYTGQVVKWRDNGSVIGGFSPLFLGFFFGGCGEPCYPCTYEDVKCGWPWSMMLNLTDNLDNYWDVFNEDHFPYFNTGFVLDWYGRVGRGPEPNIGWYEYTILNSINCNYCHCVYFCILRQCMDGWFASRDYYAKILLLDQVGGIPYSDPKFLKEWGEEMQNQFNFGNIDIKLNHLADEAVFVGGFADHRLGTISFDGGTVPQNTSSVADEAKQVELYGQKIPTVTEFEYNDSFINRQPEASITTGDGSDVYEIDRIRGSFSLYNNNSNSKLKLTDVAVKNKNQRLMPQAAPFGWLYTDIPSGINPEYASVKFSADGGAAFPIEVERLCPSLGCDLPKTIFDLKLDRMFCRTSKNNGNFLRYREATSRMNVQGSWWNDAGLTIYEGPAFEQKYYKRYVKKIVKAPYNLYIKSGETSFRSCKVGETLKDLSAGRYYFPNPVQCDVIFQHPDSSYVVDELSIDVDPLEEAEFRKTFSLRLNQFKGENNDILDSYGRYQEAVKILGKPEGNAIEMEINGTASININNTQTTDLGKDILQAIKELAAAGSLDQNTLDLLEQAGLI